MSCPVVNDSVDIGWAVAGGCAALTTLITLFTTTMHATHYQNPAVQKQVLRVLMMPCIYAIVSFLSYRYYQQYYYFSIGETAYESITLSAFLMLLMELVAMTNPQGMIQTTLATKDKRKFPFPFNCWRFRASKPYFWHALSFSVMQYVVIRPLLSIIGIICEYFGKLCPQHYSPYYAEVYLDAVDCISITIALYGLIVFYIICHDELKGRRPLNKFLAIKLIVIFTFYQGFLFDILQDYDVIKSTQLWTATNVSNGLQALCTCVEMVFFSIYMGWAYSWTDYTNPDLNPVQRETNIKTYFSAIWDAINVSDFAVELIMSTKFFIAFIQGKPGTRGSHTKLQKTFMPDTMNEEKAHALGALYKNNGYDNYGDNSNNTSGEYTTNYYNNANSTGANKYYNNYSGNVIQQQQQQQQPISPTFQYHYQRASTAVGGNTSPNSYQRIDDSVYAYQHKYEQYEHQQQRSRRSSEHHIPYTTNYTEYNNNNGYNSGIREYDYSAPQQPANAISAHQWNNAIRRTEWSETQS